MVDLAARVSFTTPYSRADFTRVVYAPRRYGAGPGPRNTPHRKAAAWAIRAAWRVAAKMREDLARMILEASHAR